MFATDLQAELAAVQAYLAEANQREAEMFRWIAAAFEDAFEVSL
jgi:hypothetical protein